MKTKHSFFAAFLILAVASIGLADSQPSPIFPASKPSEKPLYYGIGSSTAACATSIAFSRDPGKAAAIGVPILIGGNLLAAKLFRKHPRLAGLLQVGSGLGCAAGGLALHAPKPSSPLTSAQGATGSTSAASQPVSGSNNGSGLTSGSGLPGGSSTSGSGAVSNPTSLGGNSGGSSNTAGGSTGAAGGSSGNGSVGSGNGSNVASTGNSGGISSSAGVSSGTSEGTISGGTTGGPTNSTGGSIGGGAGGGGTGFFCTTGGGHDCGLQGNGGFNSGNGVGTIPPGRNKP